jgi:hypothetical protein
MDGKLRNKIAASVFGSAIAYCAAFLVVLYLSAGNWSFSLVMSFCITGVIVAGAFLSSKKMKL